MSWTIVESAVGNRRGMNCADRIVIAPGVVAVLDASVGTTRTLAEQEVFRHSQAMLDIVEGALVDSAASAASLRRAVDLATRGLDAYKMGAGLLPIPHTGGVSFAALVFSQEAARIWIVGDCWARIGTLVHAPVNPLLQLQTQQRRALLSSKVQQGYQPKDLIIAKLEEPLLQNLREIFPYFANHSFSEFSYGIVDGNIVPDFKLLDAPISGNERDVSIGTRGFPLRLASIEQNDREFARLLEGDPLLIYSLHCPNLSYGGDESFEDFAMIRATR